MKKALEELRAEGERGDRVGQHDFAWASAATGCYDCLISGKSSREVRQAAEALGLDFSRPWREVYDRLCIPVEDQLLKNKTTIENLENRIKNQEKSLKVLEQVRETLGCTKSHVPVVEAASTLLKNHQALREQVQSQEHRILDLKRGDKALGLKNSQLQSAMNGLESKLRDAEDQIKELTAENGTLAGALSRAVQVCERFEQEIKSLEEDFTNCELERAYRHHLLCDIAAVFRQNLSIGSARCTSNSIPDAVKAQAQKIKGLDEARAIVLCPEGSSLTDCLRDLMAEKRSIHLEEQGKFRYYINGYGRLFKEIPGQSRYWVWTSQHSWCSNNGKLIPLESWTELTEAQVKGITHE